MKALERFGEKLAERIFKRADSPSFIGQRMLATDFQDEVLVLAADFLATFATESASEILKPENVIFVLNKPEYDSLEQRREEHRAYQAGLSYCVNVRDRGETAVFFVRRSLVPFVDESLKEKGSVLLGNLGITPNRILAQTVEGYINEVGWSDKDPMEQEKVKTLLLQNCRRLFRDERSERICFDMMDEFVSLSFDEALGPTGYKTLGLVPVVGDQEVTVLRNIREIDRLREALAAPSKRTSYLSEHKEYAPEIYEKFEEFLDDKKWRVPLETAGEGREYFRFFQDWPECCDLAFLECAERGGARLDLTVIKGGSGRKFVRFGSILIVDESELLFEWKASNLDGCPGEITVDGQARQKISSLDLNKIGPISADTLSIPVGEQCNLKIRPENPSERRRLQRGCRNSVNVIRLDLDQAQALILFGRDQMLVVRDEDKERTVNITLPSSMSLTINSQVFKGYRSAGPASIEDEDTGEEISSISLQEGESVFLKVDWDGKIEPTVLEAVCQEAALEEPKVIDSLVLAFRDARGKLERFSEESINLEEQWATFPHFNIICENIPDFTMPYEARRSWSDDLLAGVLEKPEIIGPRTVLIAGAKVELSPKLMDTRDGIPWAESWKDRTVDAFLETRHELFNNLKAEPPLPYVRLSLFKDLIKRYALDYYKILRNYRDQHDSYDNSISHYSLIDTFFPIQSYRLPQDGKVSDAELSQGILLLAPTHPVRLLWLLRREQMCLRFFQFASDRQALKFVSTMDGLGFPANIALPDEKVFYNASNPQDAFWGAYVFEEMALDKVVDLLSKLFPGQRNRFDNPLVPDANKIYAALDYSHRVLPYRHTLRIGYSNPGSAQCLREALKNVKKNDTDQTELHHALFNQRKTRFRVDFIGTNRNKVGESFSQIIHEGKRGELPPSLEIQKSGIEDSALRNTDLSFADDIANRKSGSLLTINRCLPVLPAEGLICPLVSRSRLQENATGEMLFAFAHPASSVTHVSGEATEISSETLCSVLCYLYQTLFREPKPGASFDDDTVRAFKVEYRQDTLRRVRKLQSGTNFLFTLDTNADLAMFEAMAAGGESIIIDFDPAYHNPVARLFSSSSHNYVITTSRNSPIKKKLMSEITAILGGETGETEKATDRLFSVLNGLSGRFLKEVLQRPTDVKETIGCGLSSLLVQKIVGGSLQKPSAERGKTASVLVPIDDHFARWMSISGSERGTGQGERADLLFCTLHIPPDSDTVQIWLRVLEAKLGYHGQSGVSQKGYTQISNTWRVICQWLRLEPVSYNGSVARFRCSDSVESLFRLLDLASILDFYLRRASRLTPEFVKDFQDEEEIETFCNSVYSLTVKGKIEFNFDMRTPAPVDARLAEGQGIIAGHILHFDPEIEGNVPLEEKGLGPIALYRVFGKQTFRRLLTED